MTKVGALFSSAVLGLFLIITACPPAWAAAAQSTSLTTSPISVDLSAKPGSSATTTLQVLNNNPEPVDVSLQVDTFRASGTSGQAQILTPGPSDSFINWVTFSKNSFLAQPGVWTPVQMTISLPDYAALGYYYAVLFKPSVAVTAKSHTNILKSSNAILVLLNAQSSNEHPQISVTSFISNKKLYEYLPATFSINVYNDGNIYLPPAGDIYISRTSNFKNIIDTLPVNTTAGNVLAGTSRVYTTEWTDGFPVFVPKTIDNQPVLNQQGKPVEQLQWNFSQIHKFRFGEYYAKMVLVYNNGTHDVPIVATVSFWVIPWKLIIGFIFFIACIVGLVILVIYLSHKLRKQSKWHA